MKRYFSVVLVLLAGTAQAVDCGPYLVEHIQAQKTDILVLLREPGAAAWWKSLGTWSHPATSHYQALIQQAMASGRAVVLRFNDPYTCASTDYGTQPEMVRLM